MPMGTDLVDKVVRIVQLNTNEMQPGPVSEHIIVRIALGAAGSPDTVRDALATAVAEGRLERVDGAYALPPSDDAA